MAGGTWLSQNKRLPGAYLNFVGIPKSQLRVGERGTATMPLALNWGAEDTLIDVYSEELMGNGALAKVGFTAFDEESKLLNIMLKECALAKVYRLNKGGVKATTTIGNLTVTALYSGTFGNKITIQIVKEGELFNVSTFVNGAEQDSQKVTEIAELEANKFVTFSGTGEITENAGKPLTGGTNGEINLETALPAYLDLLKTSKWQVAAFPQLGDEAGTLKANIATFIESQRNDNGRYVQAVLANYPQANFEGIISNTNGVVINGVTFTKEEFVAAVAGIEAGANINESRTNYTIEGATQIIGQLDEPAQIKALENGQLILGVNEDGTIKIVQDINTYHTFIATKPYEFSKNRIIRVLDEIGTSIKNVWETSYMGKINNDENGRAIFRGDIGQYLTTLEGMSAIQEYISSGGIDNVIVNQGINLDIVTAEITVKPVDSMEFLYMTCNVKTV